MGKRIEGLTGVRKPKIEPGLLARRGVVRAAPPGTSLCSIGKLIN